MGCSALVCHVTLITCLLKLTFSTDEEKPQVGLTDTSSLCHRDIVDATKGSVTSPGYPGYYSVSQSCQLTLHVPTRRHCFIFFQTMDIEYQASCSFDFLSFTHDGFTRKFCGANFPLDGLPLVFGSNVTIGFFSDSTVTRGGFRFEYNFEPATEISGVNELVATNTPSYVYTCAHGVLPTLGQWYWEITTPDDVSLLLWQLVVPHDDGNCNGHMVVFEQSIKLDLTDASCLLDITGSHASHVPVLFVFQTRLGQSRGFLIQYEIATMTSPTTSVSSTFATSFDLLTDVHGWLSSTNAFVRGHYENNEMRIWKIVVSDGYRVFLMFSQFNLEYQVHCFYDSLLIIDLQNTIHGPYCGSSLPPTSLSVGNSLLLYMSTDHLISSTGFVAVYAETDQLAVGTGMPEVLMGMDIDIGVVPSDLHAQCHEYLYRQTGELMSFGYQFGMNYQDNENCSWTIVAPDDLLVHIWFVDFDIEDAESCMYDELILDLSLPVTLTFCGSHLPGGMDGYTSLNSTLVVTFYTDGSVTARGFHAYYRWRNVTDEEWAELEAALIGEITVDGGALLGPSGVFSSPGYSDRENYPPNARVVWNITVKEDLFVHLLFYEFELEEAVGVFCQFDYVQIFDVEGEIGKYCGSSRPGGHIGLTSVSHYMEMVFVSDYSIQAVGFQASYGSVNVSIPRNVAGLGCLQRINVGSGSIWSPGFELGYDYLNYLDCTWELETESGVFIHVLFEHFDVEYEINCIYDYVELVDTEGSFGRYCGDNSPGGMEGFTSANNTLVVMFHTDDYVTKTGFTLTYQSILVNIVARPGAAGEDCGGTLTKLTGAIHSPEFFADLIYPQNLRCRWDIHGPLGTVVRLRITYLVVQGSVGCNLEFVHVFDFPWSGLIFCGFLTTSNTFKDISFNSSHMTVLFKSDAHDNVGGFHSIYSIMNNPDDPFETLFPIPTDCGSFLEGDDLAGHLSSPGFLQGHLYPANRDCSWTITLREFLYVHLKFRRFQLQVHETCSRDYVEIYMGIVMTNRYCGGAPPGGAAGIISDRNTLQVVFHSNGYNHQIGFSAIYGFSFLQGTPGTSLVGHFQCHNGKVIPISHQCNGMLDCMDSSDETISYAGCAEDGGMRDCGAELEASGTGTSLYSPGFRADENYPMNAFCLWVITAPTETSIHIIFHVFNLEQHLDCSFDRLSVYDNSTLIAAFCGTRVPGGDVGITTISNVLKLELFSDSDVTFPGFYATYTNVLHGATFNIEGMFHCDNGVWIPTIYTCDENNDCGDWSDESVETGPCEEQFNCTNGELIPMVQKCDGVVQCHNGQDESSCPKSSMFACSDGEVLPRSWVCDGFEDCLDGSDEAASEHCDVDLCDPSPCLYSGTCSQVANHFFCACADGLAGQLCQYDIIDNCANNTCENGATCLDSIDSYSCLCRTAFVGDYCETALSGGQVVLHVGGLGAMETRFNQPEASNDTSDMEGYTCGATDTPCTTVMIAMSLIIHGGTIHIGEGSFQEMNRQWVTQSVHLVGRSSDSTFMHYEDLVITHLQNDRVIDVKFQRITLSGHLYLGDVALTFENCILHDVVIQLEYMRRKVTKSQVITIINSHVTTSFITTRPRELDFTPNVVLYSCLSVNVLVSNSWLDSSLFNVTAVAVNMRIKDVTFRHSNRNVTVVGIYARPGYWFTAPQEDGEVDPSVVILSRKRRGEADDSSGEDKDESEEEGEEPRPGISPVVEGNITSTEEEVGSEDLGVETVSVIEIETVQVLESYSWDGLHTAVVQIEALVGFDLFVTKSLFQYTTRAIFASFIDGTISTITISSCNFTNNEAIGPGGAVRIDQMNGRVNVLITDSLFQGNVAKSLQQLGEELVNAFGTTDASQITGSGGSVTVNLAAASGLGSQCVVRIEDNIFTNNTAENYGGTLYLTRGVFAALTNNMFSNPTAEVYLRPQVGDIMESRGDLYLQNNTFSVLSALNEVPIISYRADQDGSFMESIGLDFSCPQGFSVKPVYSAIELISTESARVPIETLMMYCHSCDSGEYTLQSSQVIVDQTNGLEVDLVSNVSCLSCPYGAECLVDVHARANFWGEVHDNAVYMYMCPENYCCQEAICGGYRSCAPHRVDKLCGHCEVGYSESLFTTKCIPDTECTYVTWFWSVILLYGIFYVLFFIFEGECDRLVRVFSEWAGEKLWGCLGVFWKTPTDHNATPASDQLRAAMGQRMLSHKRNETSHHSDDIWQATTEEIASSTSDEEDETEGAFLQIFMYYIQVPSLLQRSILYADNRSTPLGKISDFVNQIFSFNSIGLNLNTCLFKAVTAVFKTWMQSAFLLYLFVVWGVMYVLAKIFTCIFGKVGGDLLVDMSLRARFIGALVMLLLYTYQYFAENSFQLLNCVSVKSEHHRVLFIDANVTCYQGWQWGFLAFACIYVFPFSIVLAFAPALLRWRAISVRIFLLSIIFPLVSSPFLVVMFYKHRDRKHTSRKGHTRNPETLGSVDLVVSVIIEPYRNRDGLCWEGMIALRRLVLVLLATLVPNTYILLRHVGLVLACVLSQFLHMWVKPFAKHSCNVVENISLTILTSVSIMNLVKAVYFESGEIPMGIPDQLFLVYDWVEAGVLSIIPAVIGVFAAAAVLVRIIDLIVNCCRGTCRKGQTGFPAEHAGSVSIPQINVIPESPETGGPNNRPSSPRPDYSPSSIGAGPSAGPRPTTPEAPLVIAGRWSKLLMEITPEDRMAKKRSPQLATRDPPSEVIRTDPLF